MTVTSTPGPDVGDPARRARVAVLSGALVVGAVIAAWAWASRPVVSEVTLPGGRDVAVLQPHAEPGDAVSNAARGRAVARDLVDDLPRRQWFASPRDPTPANDAPDPRFHDVLRVTERSDEDDFPAIAAGGGATWLAWLSYDGSDDALRIARWIPEARVFGAWNAVPGAHGALWRPALAADRDGGAWVLWSQDRDGDRALLARRYDGSTWSAEERLDAGAAADLDPRAVVDGAGVLHVVWQGFADGQSDILYRQRRPTGWGPIVRVSPSAANDWEPALAVAAEGAVHVAWDTADAGQHDVVRRVLSADGTPTGPPVPVAATPEYEARASVAVDRGDRLWIAWEQGPAAWGKDVGHALPRPDQPRGALLYDRRTVQVAVIDGDTVLQPPPLADADPGPTKTPYVDSDRPLAGDPELVVDGAGRVHLLFRRFHSRGGNSQYWLEHLTSMTSTGWAPAVALPWSEGRLSMAPAAAPTADGLWLAWPRDRMPTNSTWVDLPEDLITEDVYAGRFVPDTAPGERLAPAAERAKVPDPWPHATERGAVAAIRAWRTEIDGASYRIVRGDLHRHTEFSTDLRGAPDGSFLDLYRYALDAADLDFVAQTDHQGGADRRYWWWLTRKAADLFTHPDGLTAMYGYERSPGWPFGHRNVIFDDPTHTPVPLGQPDAADAPEELSPWYRMHGPMGQARADDTRVLMDEVRAIGGITIPHTTATAMGTDWRDSAGDVDVNVEIFQGYRTSQEQAGAPLVYAADDNPSLGGRPGGYVRAAWDQGLWLGVTASSDHMSTHVAFAMAYVQTPSRAAILDAFKQRRTYAATDEIALDLRMGDRFMGSRFTAPAVPTLVLEVRGTGPIDEVAILRDGDRVHTATADGADLSLTWDDPAPLSGTHYYYVRVAQRDGNLAWSTPIWVTLAP